MLKEKEELRKENQALSRQLEEVRQGCQLVFSVFHYNLISKIFSSKCLGKE